MATSEPSDTEERRRIHSASVVHAMTSLRGRHASADLPLTGKEHVTYTLSAGHGGLFFTNHRASASGPLSSSLSGTSTIESTIEGGSVVGEWQFVTTGDMPKEPDFQPWRACVRDQNTLENFLSLVSLVSLVTSW
jgi:hypothetical protein